ncbi:hypothetical protein [Planctomicrobium sp. SH664]|uniref:hypothetical protein n=1 Tax=Planctomicrobium sp. SH664 TaxID=3448125 RepID=UPI003F5B443D
MLSTLRPVSCLLWMCVALCSLQLSVQAAEEAPLRIYLAADGVDTHDGLSAATPVLTLARAEQVARTQLKKREKPVEVLIGPGVYRQQVTYWKLTMPDHTITFRPADEGQERPIFDGEDGTKSWFTLRHSAGQRTNLHFQNLLIRNYKTALSFNGTRDDVEHCNRANRVAGCRFENIGEKSTACIRFVNSKENEVVDCEFINIDSTVSKGLLHAIYVAHHSSDNRILRNHFEKVCGDPIRLRDGSNRNQINENVFIRSGIQAACSDWFCDKLVDKACTKEESECPSWNNEFQRNTVDVNYAGKPVKTVYVYQPSTKAEHCQPEPNAVRFITSGNKRK